MLILWGRETSINVKKILWTLEELELTFEHKNVGGAYGGLTSPQYLELNPNGLIPTLQDGDLVLWESNTIIRYLAAEYGKSGLWIENCGKRALNERWMDWSTGTFWDPFKDMLFHSVRLSPEKRDPKILATAVVCFEQGLAILEEELKKQPYLSSPILGTGDIAAGVFIYYYYGLDIQRNKKFPHVEAWYQRLQTHQAYCKYIMIPIA